MIEVNLIGEQTDLTHAKELHSANTSENDKDVLSSIIGIVFTTEKSGEEQREELSELFDSLPEDAGLDVSDVDVDEVIDGVQQLQQILPQEFNHMTTLFQFIIDEESLEDAEVAKAALQDGKMDDVTLTIPRENESLSGLML